MHPSGRIYPQVGSGMRERGRAARVDGQTERAGGQIVDEVPAEVRAEVRTEVRTDVRTDVRAEVRTVGVIGAGRMGRGIAHAAALGGYRTILEALLPNALRRAETEIRGNLDKAVERGKVNPSDADAAFSRLEYADSVDQAARDADLVIEAVPEEMESKIEIFPMLDKICRPTTILASNTSSLSLTESASLTYRAKKSVGMHFFNPVHTM